MGSAGPIRYLDSKVHSTCCLAVTWTHSRCHRKSILSEVSVEYLFHLGLEETAIQTYAPLYGITSRFTKSIRPLKVPVKQKFVNRK
jgi:hypothetical protein